jgi:hypothetical protein
MTKRRCILTAGLVLFVVAPMAAQDPERPPSVAGCPSDNLAFHRCALEKARTFNPRRTATGKPDLQGFWRSLLTQSFSVEGVPADEPMVRNPVMPWIVAPSEIVEPADRKIPYQAWAAPIGRKGVNFAKYIDPRTTCSTGGIPRLALQDANQILQPSTDDFVVWLFEDHHVQRLIAMDDRSAPGAEIKTWNGISRGRWDGNTLVIDTTNLNGYTWLDDSGNFYTDGARTTERLTLIDADTIHYEVTIQDPKAYTAPWKLAWALVRVKDADFELFEEACREGEASLDVIRQQGFQYYFGEPWRGR